MLDQLIRDYTNNIEAEEAVATTIGNLRMMEQDHKEDVTRPPTWGGKRAGRQQEGGRTARRRERGGGRQVRQPGEGRPGRQCRPRRRPGTRSRRSPRADRGRRQAEGRTRPDEGEADRTPLEARPARPAPRRRRRRTRCWTRPEHRRPRPDERRLAASRRRYGARRQKALGKQELAASSLDAQFEQLDSLGDAAETEARLARAQAVTGAPVASWAGAPPRPRGRDRRAAAPAPRCGGQPPVPGDGGDRSGPPGSWRAAGRPAPSAGALDRAAIHGGHQPVRIAAARGDRREDRRAAAAMTETAMSGGRCPCGRCSPPIATGRSRTRHARQPLERAAGRIRPEQAEQRLRRSASESPFGSGSSNQTVLPRGVLREPQAALSSPTSCGRARPSSVSRARRLARLHEPRASHTSRTSVRSSGGAAGCRPRRSAARS